MSIFLIDEQSYRGSGLGLKEFDFEEWLNRWRGNTSHIERMAMLGMIPHIWLNPEQTDTILTEIILPLADGMHAVRKEKDYSDAYKELRLEAWFLLTEWYFNEKSANCAASAVNPDRLRMWVKFFEPAANCSNSNFTHLSAENLFVVVADSRKRLEMRAFKDRIHHARENLVNYVFRFVKACWNLEQETQYWDNGNARFRKNHKLVSVEMRAEIFQLIESTDSSWLSKMPWQRSDLEWIMENIFKPNNQVLMEFVPRYHNHGDKNGERSRIGAQLATIALHQNWTDIPGIFKPWETEPAH